MLILVSNVPPVCMNKGDYRIAIAQYNQAYTMLPQLYPNNVKLVDMWTPMVDTNGWGLRNMFLMAYTLARTDGTWSWAPFAIRSIPICRSDWSSALCHTR